MTPEEFTSTSIAILRTVVGWQSAIARRLNVDSRTVRRWLKAGEIPGWVDDRLKEMIGAADHTGWPRDEWVLGDIRTENGGRREYIVHLQYPRFAARIVTCDENGAAVEKDQPADLVSGVVYQISPEECFCEIDWINPVKPGEVVKWLEAAADAVIDNS